MNNYIYDILAVVDAQIDFITGSLGNKYAQAIVPAIENEVEKCNKNNRPVVFTKDTHGDDYLETSEGKKLPIIHTKEGTVGWQIGLKVTPNNYEFVNKNTFGYLHWDKVLSKYLEGKDLKKITIAFCGLKTDICVISNVLIVKTMYPDVNVVVLANCCAGTTPEKHKAALEVMKSCQIDVVGE